VDGSRQDKTCLYSVNPRWYGDDLRWNIVGIAPYLVELDVDDKLTEEVLTRGWNDNWGIFFRTGTSIEKLRRHFRQFLTVSTDTGKRLVFRYYDPRVLRLYLPTCKSEELQSFFGPVDVFIMPGGEPDTAIEYRLKGNRLSKRFVPLEQTAGLCDPDESRPVRTDIPVEHRRRGLIIRKAQIEAISTAKSEEFCERVKRHVKTYFARKFDVIGEARIDEMIRDGIGRAQRWGFRSARDVCKFIDLMVVFGSRFDQDRRFAWAESILTQPATLAPGARMTALFGAAKEHLRNRSRSYR
jgi:hypothetical protein